MKIDITEISKYLSMIEESYIKQRWENEDRGVAESEPRASYYMGQSLVQRDVVQDIHHIQKLIRIERLKSLIEIVKEQGE